nr:uncharacterized protein LOC123497586 [Aegilops tauschii subsp. strangulata]
MAPLAPQVPAPDAADEVPGSSAPAAILDRALSEMTQLQADLLGADPRLVAGRLELDSCWLHSDLAEGCRTEEFNAYLLQGTLPEKEEDAEEQGHELLADIHGGDCAHHSSSHTLVDNAFRSGFYCPMELNDATELICYSSLAHPRSNSQVERANTEVLRGLKARTFKKKLEAYSRGWLDGLQSVLYSIYTTATKPTGRLAGMDHVLGEERCRQIAL